MYSPHNIVAMYCYAMFPFRLLSYVLVMDLKRNIHWYLPWHQALTPSATGDVNLLVKRDNSFQ